MTTPRELITGALRLINVVQANENPTADDMDISFEALNAMLDSWSNEKLSIFSMNPYEFQLAANQKEYTLGPGGDWEITRPMELLMMYVMYLDGGGECSGPTPPACMDLVLDTFTRTGNLSTHVGEIGASWTPSNALGDGWFIDGGHSISNILLNGDGTLTPDTFRQPMVYPSGSVSLNDTFTFDIEFEVGTNGAGPYTGFLGNLDTGEAYVSWPFPAVAAPSPSPAYNAHAAVPAVVKPSIMPPATPEYIGSHGVVAFIATATVPPVLL